MMKIRILFLSLGLLATPATSNSADWQEVERLRGDGKVSESLKLAETLRSTIPPSMELDREYALSLNASGRKDEAIAVLAPYKTKELDPTTATAINTLGWIYLTRGNYSEATSTFEIITNSTSFSFDENKALSGKAFNNLGYTLTLVGRTNDARNAFQRAVDLGNENALGNLKSLSESSNKDTLKKVSSIDRASATKAIKSYIDNIDGFDEAGSQSRKKSREDLLKFIANYGHADVAVEEIVRRLDKRRGGFKTNQGMINGLTTLLDLYDAGSLSRTDRDKAIRIAMTLRNYDAKRTSPGDRDSSVVASTASALAKLGD